MLRHVAIRPFLIIVIVLGITVIITSNITQTFAIETSTGGLKKIPSETTDFPGDNPSVVEVHVTSAKKSTLDDYHIKGAIKNIGEGHLQYVKVTGYFYDSDNQTIGVTTCCYAHPLDIERGHTATFDSFVKKK